ncbi:hypothetical protein Pcinc_035526 [Petrolisthes cinctipes]|uniref:Uncharacterized protein n=1 Tax=Petrolisthes cinctipes TaxID=88211 RepID=A0AAE1EN78_PETCI|nr:hypothetical protein Pcinc_035526 [Petrolisthes cinctipes]
MQSRHDQEWSTIIQPIYESELLRITVESERIQRLKNDMQEARNEIRMRQGIAHNLQKVYERHEEMTGDFQRKLNGKRQEELTLTDKPMNTYIFYRYLSQKQNSSDITYLL